MLNKVVLMGRIGSEISLRRTNSGKAVTSFSIACDRDFKGQNGEKETDWFDIVCWNGLAETVEKYFSKGRMAVVSGRLQIRNWTDKEGNKRKSAEVVAENVYFGDSKREASSGSQSGENVSGTNYYGNGQSGVSAGYNEPFAMIEEDSEQLPF